MIIFLMTYQLSLTRNKSSRSCSPPINHACIHSYDQNSFIHQDLISVTTKRKEPGPFLLVGNRRETFPRTTDGAICSITNIRASLYTRNQTEGRHARSGGEGRGRQGRRSKHARRDMGMAFSTSSKRTCLSISIQLPPPPSPSRRSCPGWGVPEPQRSAKFGNRQPLCVPVSVG